MRRRLIRSASAKAAASAAAAAAAPRARMPPSGGRSSASATAAEAAAGACAWPVPRDDLLEIASRHRFGKRERKRESKEIPMLSIFFFANSDEKPFFFLPNVDLFCFSPSRGCRAPRRVRGCPLPRPSFGASMVVGKRRVLRFRPRLRPPKILSRRSTGRNAGKRAMWRKNEVLFSSFQWRRWAKTRAKK